MILQHLDPSLFGSSFPVIGFQNITRENVTIDIPEIGGNTTNGSKSVTSGSRDDIRLDEPEKTWGIHGMCMALIMIAIFGPNSLV